MWQVCFDHVVLFTSNSWLLQTRSCQSVYELWPIISFWLCCSESSMTLQKRHLHLFLGAILYFERVGLKFQCSFQKFTVKVSLETGNHVGMWRHTYHLVPPLLLIFGRERDTKKVHDVFSEPRKASDGHRCSETVSFYILKVIA